MGERPRVMVAEGERSPIIEGIKLSQGSAALPLTDSGLAACDRRLGLSVVTPRISARTLGLVAGEVMANSNLSAVIKEGRITDLVPQRSVHIVQPERVLRTIERAVPAAEFHRVLLMDSHRVHLETIGAQEKAVSRGDLVRAGVLTDFSVMGVTRPHIQSYCQRLICSNGATTQDIFEDFRFGSGGEGDDMWQWFRDMTKKAYRSLGKIVDRWQHLREMRIPEGQRAEMLEAWMKEARLPEQVQMAVQARAVNEPPRNRYDMVNLLTWAQSHVITEPAAVSRTMRRVSVMQTHEHAGRICPLCHVSRN